MSEVSTAKIYLYIFIAEPKQVGSEGANIFEVSAAEPNIFGSIFESIKVGLYRRYSPNMSGNITSTLLRCTSLWRVCRGGQTVLVPGV